MMEVSVRVHVKLLVTEMRYADRSVVLHDESSRRIYPSDRSTLSFTFVGD
jgi:hypothetical protein